MLEGFQIPIVYSLYVLGFRDRMCHNPTPQTQRHHITRNGIVYSSTSRHIWKGEDFFFPFWPPLKIEHVHVCIMDKVISNIIYLRSHASGVQAFHGFPLIPIIPNRSPICCKIHQIDGSSVGDLNPTGNRYNRWQSPPQKSDNWQTQGESVNQWISKDFKPSVRKETLREKPFYNYILKMPVESNKKTLKHQIELFQVIRDSPYIPIYPIVPVNRQNQQPSGVKFCLYHSTWIKPKILKDSPTQFLPNLWRMPLSTICSEVDTSVEILCYHVGGPIVTIASCHVQRRLRERPLHCNRNDFCPTTRRLVPLGRTLKVKRKVA